MVGVRAAIPIGTSPLTRGQVRAVARDRAPVELTGQAREAIAAARGHIDALATDPRPHYGVSTGFGALATTHIPPQRRAALQRSLIRSHAAGAGPAVEAEVVRAMMVLRLRTLASGRTGIRLATAQALASLLNADLLPVVHEHGSLGCSGDLAPLSAVALALMGEGVVIDGTGTGRPAAQALGEHGIEPVVLAEKEGLALINGTDGMLGMLVLAIHDVAGLLDTADLTAAMTTEALLGTDRAFAADLQELRPHPGQAVSAARMHAMMAGSEIVASHRTPECTRVQDAYSMRCAPQVHGAARDTTAFAVSVVDTELRSTVDNPVVLADGRVESNGNFHGAPLGYAADFLAIAVADVASMAERRTDRMLDTARSHGLPPFLAGDPGVDSGHMIAHYTQAAIVNELKRLAVPASVDSIPTSAMQEDHVSMGWAAARKLRRAVDGLCTVLAIEAMTAARALRLRAPLRPAPATAAAVDALYGHTADGDRPASARVDGASAGGASAGGASAGGASAGGASAGGDKAGGPGPDRHLAPEIAAAERAVRAGVLRDAVAPHIDDESTVDRRLW